MAFWTVYPLPRLSLGEESLPERPLRIGVVTGTDAEAVAGVVLGGEEGARSAALLRQTVDVLTAAAKSDPGAAARWLADQQLNALVSTLSDPDECARLVEAVAASGLLVINAAAAADELRGEGWARHVFHVSATRAMYRDALAAAAAEDGSARDTQRSAFMWHTSLERFGARQLNERFHARFARGMTGEAWAGWMAMKVAIEACLRSGPDDANRLRTYLERDNAQFDGHKGVPLSFRSWDHQLRQPLYVAGVGADEVIAVPTASGGSARSVRERLDTLGTESGVSRYRWRG